MTTMATKGTAKVGRALRLLYSSSSNNPHPQNNRSVSSSSKVMKLLTESTTIAQDGTTMGELPILIRRATRDTFPFTSHSFCGDKIRSENVFDMTFKDMLENCDSVSDVFNLLEVPPDKVQGHSAVYALQRLHILMSLNTDWKQIHSFIRRAVIGELYHIVERDIRLLSNFSLVTLVDCYFSDEGFSATCSGALVDEISHRLVESLLTVEELLSLVQSLKTGFFSVKNKLSGLSNDQNFGEKRPASFKDVLSENASIYLATSGSERGDEMSKSSSMTSHELDNQKYQELLQNVWVHLASRCNDMDENTIPWTMQLLPSNKKMFVPLLDKQLTNIWPMLSAETAAMCLDNLVRLRSHNSAMMTKLGRYAFLNIHLMTPTVLLSYLRTFLHFSVDDTNLIQVIEKCISKTAMETPSDLLVLCVEYLRSCAYVSPIIMEVAAQHFQQHWESYTPLEIFALLRVFGQLNYLPSKPQDFVLKVETCLNKRFNVMDENHLLEVLASFTFVRVFFKDLGKRVNSEYFYGKVQAMKNPSRTHALMWKKILNHAVIMGPHQTTGKDHRTWVLNYGKMWSIPIYRDTEVFAISKMRSALNALLGPEYHHVLPFYNCQAVYVDKYGVPIRISTEKDGFAQPVSEPARSLVILLRSSSHFTSNTQQLTGSQEQRMDHLKKLGYTPVEIRAADFYFPEGTCAIRSQLAQFIDFDNPEVALFPERCYRNLEEKYHGDWVGDGMGEREGEGEENISEVFIPLEKLFDDKRSGFFVPSLTPDNDEN